MASELLEFPGGLIGVALNLDEDSIGAVIMGGASHIQEGDPVSQTGRVLSVPVGDGLDVLAAGGGLFEAPPIMFFVLEGNADSLRASRWLRVLVTCGFRGHGAISTISTYCGATTSSK